MFTFLISLVVSSVPGQPSTALDMTLENLQGRWIEDMKDKQIGGLWGIMSREVIIHGDQWQERDLLSGVVLGTRTIKVDYQAKRLECWSDGELDWQVRYQLEANSLTLSSGYAFYRLRR